MKSIDKQLIAQCGMNCGVCMAYLREKNKCPGCRWPNANKPVTRVRCKIKNCKGFQKGKVKFCFECKNFPCDDLEHLDNRYKKKYDMSMIKNLKKIEEKGIQKFLEDQHKKYKCPKCNGMISVHNKKCYSCEKSVV